MPFDSGTGIFTRIWKFVDQYLPGDDALRAGFDTAFDDVANGLNGAVDYFNTELAGIAATRGLYLGEKPTLPTTDNTGGPLVDGNSVIVGDLQYYWKDDVWNEVGIPGANALGLILLGLENTPEGRALARTALGLGGTALLDWNPADITGSMRARDNVVLGFGTGTGPTPGTSPIPSDFTIRHDGANTYMQVLGDGNVFLDTDTFTLRSKDGLKTGLTVVPAGAVTLRHDHAAKLATSATGVTVTGALSADTFSGAALLKAADIASIAADDKAAAGALVVAYVSSRRVLYAPQSLNGLGAVDFNSIPSWVNTIKVMFDQASFNSVDMLVQLGTASAFETTGYVSGSFNTAGSTQLGTGFNLVNDGSGSFASGMMTITRMVGDTWAASHGFGNSAGRAGAGGGRKGLAAALTRLRVTRVSGTWTGGSVSVEVSE